MSEDGTNIESNMNDEKNNKKTIKDLFVELVRKSGGDGNGDGKLTIKDVKSVFDFGKVDIVVREETSGNAYHTEKNKKIGKEEQEMSMDILGKLFEGFTKGDVNSMYLGIGELLQQHNIKSNMFEYNQTDKKKEYAHLGYIFAGLCAHMNLVDTKILSNPKNPSPNDVTKILSIYENQTNTIQENYDKRLEENYVSIHVNIFKKDWETINYPGSEFSELINFRLFGDKRNVKYLESKNKRSEIKKINISNVEDFETYTMYKDRLSGLEEIKISYKPTTFKFPSEVSKIVIEAKIDNLDFSSCKKLKNLKLSGGIEELPKSLFSENCKKSMVNLDISDNLLGEDEINKVSQFTLLEDLNISGNFFENFPENIYNLSNLKKLKIGDSNINFELSNNIEKLKNLETLDIMDCKIKNLPDGIGNMEKLKHLRLVRLDNLNRLPNNIGNIKNLEDFTCENTGVSKLPQSFINLEHLKNFMIMQTASSPKEGGKPFNKFDLEETFKDVLESNK